MRPGQNKRMRGRNNNNNSNNNRKGPNPLTRSYESNGPDVKIRGTAHHIGEKYLQLARDAQSSGDPVMAESYLQHAEHYFQADRRPPSRPSNRPPMGTSGRRASPSRTRTPTTTSRACPTASPRRASGRPSRITKTKPRRHSPTRATRIGQAYANGGQQQPYEARQNFDRQNQPQPNSPAGGSADSAAGPAAELRPQPGSHLRQPQRAQRSRRTAMNVPDRIAVNKTVASRIVATVRAIRAATATRAASRRAPRIKAARIRVIGRRATTTIATIVTTAARATSVRARRRGSHVSNRRPTMPIGGGLPAFITAPMRSNVPDSANEQPPVEVEDAGARRSRNGRRGGGASAPAPPSPAEGRVRER